MQVTSYGGKGFYALPATQAYGGGANAPASKSGDQRGNDQATIVTLSDAARAASVEVKFATVVAAVRETLNTLLSEAGRQNPLEDGKIALDMSSLSQRELFAIAKTDDGLFTCDERKAAELEMERRLSLALSGPAGVSDVTGDFRALYKAAADHFDGLSAEQKAEPAWQAARNAIDKALIALNSDPAKFPSKIDGDPVAAWLASRSSGDIEGEFAGSLVGNLRNILDQRYAAADEAGTRATFDKKRPGHFIDLGEFGSRAVSAMALNREGSFSPEEEHAAKSEIRLRANLALSESYKDAARSGDPTAFSRNIIAIYSSMSADERLAAGISENLLSAAISSYESTTRLTDIMAMGANSMGGMESWFSR